MALADQIERIGHGAPIFAAHTNWQEFVSFSQMDASNPEHFEAYNYLVNERKISRDIILRYRLGFCTTGKYANRIIIPSFDASGDVNYFVGRYYGTDKKIKQKIPYLNPVADKDVIIFNEGLVNWDSTVYLVEGAFEMLSFPVVRGGGVRMKCAPLRWERNGLCDFSRTDAAPSLGG